MTQPNRQAPRPLLPPDEAFWKRYSPHHEFPLSTVTSVAICGLGLGVLLLSGYLANLSWHDESQKPPAMDVVEYAAAEGGGNGGQPGPLGDPNGQDAKKENVDSKSLNKPEPKQAPQKIEFAKIKPDAPSTKAELDPSPIDTNPVINSDKLEKEIERAINEASKATTQQGPNSRPKGVPNPGTPGSGNKVGIGSARPLTQQQRRQLRWRIDFKGTGEEHLDKLKAWGVTLAFPVPQPPGAFWVIDLTSGSLNGRLDNLGRQRNKVKWYNQNQRSLADLARVLGFKSIPPYAVILLPHQREQQMIQLEHDYKGLSENEIELTEFIIERRGSEYVPVVVNQIPKKR